MPLFCNCKKHRNVDSNAVDNAINDVLSSLCCCGCEKKCTRCVNLVQDPSFEARTFDWITSGVFFTDNSVFEGAIQAALGPGIASIYQEVSLRGVNGCPLLFSFNAFADISPESDENSGILIAEVSWLDENFNFIGLGLRMLVPADRLYNTSRITFVAQTDVVPKNAAYAKVAFSKGEGLSESGDIIYLDYIILAPMAGKNLVRNGGFEVNLTNWIADPATSFVSAFDESLVDSGNAFTSSDGQLFQDISIRQLVHRTPFLLSFAVEGEGPVSLSVRVDWISQAGATIGNGLTASIPEQTLPNQQNYLTYVFVTTPPVPGTAFARIIFDADVPTTEDLVRIDQVLFVPVLITNLVNNPSFEIQQNCQIVGWNQSLVTLLERADVYEGSFDVGIGETGGALWQDIELDCPEGHCFFFSAGLGFRQTSVEAIYGTAQIKVIWLDRYDNELGIGLNLIVDRTLVSNIVNSMSWVPYIGITDPAPEGTAKARILFTKTDSPQGFVEIDNVVFARIV